VAIKRKIEKRSYATQRKYIMTVFKSRKVKRLTRRNLKEEGREKTFQGGELKKTNERKEKNKFRG